LVFGAGAGSRDARALPGRLAWRIGPQWSAGPVLAIGLSQACCLNGQPTLRLRPGWGRLRVDIGAAGANPAAAASAVTSPDAMHADGAWLGQWPAAWLVGLGTPWNTLQPGGVLRLSTQDLKLDWAAGRFALSGSATLEVRDFSSRIVTLPRLGSYRLAIHTDPAQAGTAQIGLSTIDGALQLSGSGSWGATGLRLRGEASATDADQPALNNLLNIIGRREGARSLLSIG
ncbi:MAG: type II secretion system protein N, partial [Leptothrix sp. (in: b-proteobacteria)]